MDRDENAAVNILKKGLNKLNVEQGLTLIKACGVLKEKSDIGSPIRKSRVVHADAIV